MLHDPPPVRLTNHAKADIRILSKPVRCPTCKRLTLVQRDGEDTVYCRMRDCTQGTITAAEYEHMVAKATGTVVAV